MLTEMHQIKVQ